MNSTLPFLWTLFWALLAQALLFRFGVIWGGYGLFAIHVYALLKMPVGWPPTTYLILAAATGFVMDVICFTGGIHLAASVTLGFAYPTLTSSFESREGLRQGHVLDPRQDGWRRYAAYTALGLGLYWAVIFGLQNGWSLMGRSLIQIPASTALNVMAFLMIQGLLNRRKTGGAGNVSAYPWN